MPNLVHDARLAGGSLRRAAGYAAPVLATMMLGVALSGPVLAFARAGLNAPAPVPAPPTWDRAPGGGWTPKLLLTETVQAQAISALLWVGVGMAALLLCGALVNLGTLVLSRASARHQETGIRAALGATPWTLVRAAGLEGALLGLCGGAAGVLLGTVGGPLLRGTWPGRAEVTTAFSPSAGLGATAALLAGFVVVASALPALSGARKGLQSVLGAGARATAGPAEGFVRKALTVLQFAASVTLLTGAVLLARGSVPRTDAAALGMDPRDTLTFELDLPAPSTEAQAEVLRRIGRVPGVRAVSASSPGAWVGLGPRDWMHTRCRGCVEYFPVPILAGNIRHLAVSPGYFQALGVRVLDGREFHADSGGRREALINRTFAAYMLPRAVHVGQRVSFTGPFGQLYDIVGVVDDVRAPGPGSTSEIPPTVYVSSLLHAPRTLAMAVRVAGDPIAASGAVLAAAKSAAPGAEVREVMTMRQVLDAHAAPLRWFAALLGVMAAGALVLSTGGLYGVMTFSVARRTREIGIRMAIGATERHVMRQVLREAARIALFGAMFGAVGAFTLARMLQLQFQGVRPFDPGVYLCVAAVLAAVTLAGAYVPARRATRVMPNVALRAD